MKLELPHPIPFHRLASGGKPRVTQVRENLYTQTPFPSQSSQTGQPHTDRRESRSSCSTYGPARLNAAESPRSGRRAGGPGTDVCELGPGDRALSGCELTLEDDTDGDGLPNGAEVIAGSNPNRKDAGQVIDTAVLDDDSDQVRNEADNCRDAANLEQSDLDADGEGDACDPDADGDRIEDAADNCLDMPNLQSDQDRDGVGDDCDEDLDGDQIPNAQDLCPTRMHGDPNYGGCPPLQPGDADGDGVLDNVDNCRTVENPGQLDADGNGAGDVCEDPDGDNVTSDWDNCPSAANPAQTDTNGDGIGDACSIPSFEEWIQQILEADPSLAWFCDWIGGGFCEMLFAYFYFMMYGVDPGVPGGLPV